MNYETHGEKSGKDEFFLVTQKKKKRGWMKEVQ